jgi:hypothetical protein
VKFRLRNRLGGAIVSDAHKIPVVRRLVNGGDGLWAEK